MSQLHARLEELRRPALAGYLVVILLATLTPFVFDTVPSHMWYRLNRALIPTFHRVDVLDAARNVVLFAGWGLVWMATAPRGRTWLGVRQATLWGCLISMLVELCQVASSNRLASINDVTSNTLGSLVGAFCFGAVVYTLKVQRERKSYFGLPAALLAASYGASVMLEAVVPLFRAIGQVNAGLRQRTRMILDAFHWSSIFNVAWTDLLLFLPAAVLTTVALVEAGRPKREAARQVMIGGVVLTLLAEVMHAPLGIAIDLGSWVARAGGVVLGAWLTVRYLGAFSQNVRGADRPRLLVSVYGLLLLLWAWRPFIPEFDRRQYARKLHSSWWIPLALTGRWNDVFSVVDISVPFFLGVPAGALLAVWPLRRAGPLRTALPGIYMAFLLEAGQLFIVGREPDITDFLVAAAGVATGWLCLRRAGFQPYGELLPSPVTGRQPEGARR
jgi:VanZ family protein